MFCDILVQEIKKCTAKILLNFHGTLCNTICSIRCHYSGFIINMFADADFVVKPLDCQLNYQTAVSGCQHVTLFSGISNNFKECWPIFKI